ncbi:MaoC/PaaZ C-terminal domain-containing protein [Bradyrhizobium betae]|uniref:MaoC family dehydratase n=1 Tax=Bradyrhizobium betae TaxID=244734 RepID=UPI003D664619
MAAAARHFEIDDQRWFAAASGDCNPIHVDPAWAATHFPGALVVHGMHVLLWALNELATLRPGTSFAAIDATFVKPVVVGDRVEASISEDGKLVRVTLMRDIAMVARITYGDSADRRASEFQARGALASPRPRPVSDFAGLTGTAGLPQAITALPTRFGALASSIGVDRLLGLAGISTLVGMDCPGLRSMLSKVTVRIAPGDSGELAFRVRKFHDAMSLVEIDVRGLGLEGSVSAFAGREPAASTPNDALRGMVSPGEFSGQRPLIVGASSGLGASTAKLLAAGGADPLLTWHASAPDDTVQTVRSFGASGQMLRLDATAPAQGLADLVASGWDGRQLYYFATPRIFRRRVEPYQAQDFLDFKDVFVTGFRAIVDTLKREHLPLTVFYPSTVAIDEAGSDLAEYRDAKLAGEQLCYRMEKVRPA